VKKKPRKRSAPPKEVVQLMEKVKSQLASFKKPVEVWAESTIWDEPWRFRSKSQQQELDVFDYMQMDPFWMSTMGGQFAGRVVNRTKERSIR
jgi:hypothetical protein